MQIRDFKPGVAVALAFLCAGCAAGTVSAPDCADPATKERVLLGLQRAMGGMMGGHIEIDTVGRRITAGGETVGYTYADNSLSLTKESGASAGSWDIRNVRAISRDEAANSWSCAAEIGEPGDASFSLPVSYTSTITEEGVPVVSGEFHAPGRPDPLRF